MDVVSARQVEQELLSRIDQFEQKVRGHIAHPIPSAFPNLVAQLEGFEKEILEGDWGGYYEAYRRPLIARLDESRNLLGIAIPGRAEEVWRRPAPRSIGFPTYTAPQPSTTRPATATRALEPVVIVLFASGFSSEKCSICWEGLTDDNEAGFTSCGHHFHVPCIRRWAKQKGGVTIPCPQCNQNILERLPSLSTTQQQSESKQQAKENESLQAINARLQKETQEVKDTNTSLQQTLQVQRTQARELQNHNKNKMDELTTQIAALAADKARLEKDALELNTINASLQQRLQEAQAQICLYERTTPNNQPVQPVALDAENRSLRNVIIRLETEKESQRTANEAFRNIIIRLEIEKDDLHQQLEQLTKKNIITQYECRQLRETIEPEKQSDIELALQNKLTNHKT